MGASADGEYKRQRGVLSRLKKIAVVIAILDLILAINDSRNVGRFFLLLTMSSTFDTSPENVIRDHCLKNVEGICETYFTTIASGGPTPLYRTVDGKSSHYYGATKAFHRYIFPDTFKELVNSWLAMFDQSRADANVSFYYDGGGDKPLSPPPPPAPDDEPYPQETYRVDKKYNLTENNNHHIHQSRLNSSDLHADLLDSGRDKKGPPLSSNNDKSLSSTSTNSSESTSTGPGRPKRDISPPNRDPDDGNSADKRGETVGESEKDANPNTHQVTITSSSSAASPLIIPQHNFKGMMIGTKNEILSTTLHIQDDLLLSSTQPSTKKEDEEKVKQRAKPISPPIMPPPPPPPVMDGIIGRRELFRGTDHHCKAGSTAGGPPPPPLLPAFDNGIMRQGPKKLISFVQDEVFTRWPCLLQKVRDVLEQKNMTSSVSPEAGRIKMFIEVRPFGPDSFKDSAKRLKATQQILFDYPWLTMFQVHSRLSGAFTKMFLVISLYTWIWGTVIALMLLIGSLTEDQTTLHGWIIFNILYSLLLFMIDDWIHSNICPHRSSVSVWLFVIYSLYKPIAAWIAFTQWSEMKKVGSSAPFSGSKRTSSDCLNRRRSRGNNRSPSGKRRLRSLSDGTTKETTVVDIITPTPTPSLPTRSTSINSRSSLVSTVERGEAREDDGGGSGDDEGGAPDGNCDDLDIEEFEDLEEEDLDEEDSDSEEDGERKEKVGCGNDDEE